MAQVKEEEEVVSPRDRDQDGASGEGEESINPIVRSRQSIDFGGSIGERRISWNPRDISILVIDDELTARKVITRILQRSGYNAVLAVASGKEALSLIDDGIHEFHLIMCDLHMPDMDGIEVVEKIRARKASKAIPIVMLSATEDLSVVYKCLQKGADDYLLKPIQLAAAKNLWQNVWRKRKEKIYTAQLTDEQSLRSQMDEEMVELKSQIETLKVQFTEAVETPVQVIKRTLAEISKDNSLTDEVQNAISAILKSLSSSDLYKPAISKFLESDSTLDPLTREWLSSEFKYDVQPTKTSLKASSDSWPIVKEAITGTDEESDRVRLQLRSWDFDVWSYEEQDLLPFLESIFKDPDFALMDRFKIDPKKLRAFLIQVRKHYNKTNPYHNFRHAFDVCQACYLILTNCKGAAYLMHLEIFAILVSAICHDLEHPGLNNNFQANTNSDLAITYNDKSILENFHCSLAFKLLLKPECNILEGLSKTEYKDFRKLCISTILATDMAQHMTSCAKFNTIMETTFTREETEHRQVLLEIIVKCGDISNPTRPLRIANYWSEMVQQEFYAQGDEEKRLSLPVSAFMDRENTSAPKMTIGFISFFVAPLFGSLAKLLPGISVCLERLEETKLHWQRLLAEEEADSAATAAK